MHINKFGIDSEAYGDTASNLKQGTSALQYWKGN